MPEAIKKLQVLIAGTYTLSDAYPNVRYRIEALKNHPDLEVKEIHESSRTSFDYKSPRSSLLSLLLMAVSQLRKSLLCLVSIIHHRKVDILYVPYPAVPILYLLSFAPRRWLPQRIVADIFISLYDTIVIDRQLLDADSIFARCLKRVERRSLLVTTVSLTDTPENSDYLTALLQLPPSCLQDLPLSINESCFNDLIRVDDKPESDNDAFKVLFVGTLVPLHRIDLILDAIALIEPRRHMKITFIGDGQQSDLLKVFLQQKNYNSAKITIHWVREWQSSAQIQAHVREAHLCLGIMGNAGKSRRVWPFKNYLYMASGKSLITAETPVSARLSGLVDYPVFITVKADAPKELANAILVCANDPEFPGELPANAARFFSEELSLNASCSRLFSIMTGQPILRDLSLSPD